MAKIILINHTMWPTCWLRQIGGPRAATWHGQWPPHVSTTLARGRHFSAWRLIKISQKSLVHACTCRELIPRPSPIHVPARLPMLVTPSIYMCSLLILKKPQSHSLKLRLSPQKFWKSHLYPKFIITLIPEFTKYLHVSSKQYKLIFYLKSSNIQ